MSNDKSIRSERALIGGLLRDGSLLAHIDLDPSMFAQAEYGEAFDAIRQLVSEGKIPDVVTAADRLESTQPRIDWLGLLADLYTNEICTSAAAPQYAEHIRTGHLKRRAAVIGHQLVSSINADGQAAIDEALRQLIELNAGARNHDHAGRAVISSAVEAIERAFEARQAGGLVGIDTGLAALNDATGGFHATDLVVIPARPAMGKTGVLLNLLINCGVPAGMISTEQAADQMGMRMISIAGSASGHRMRQGSLRDDDWARVSAGSARLLDKPFWLNDDAGVTIHDIQRQARTWVHRHGIKILFVDYIQRIHSHLRGEKHQQVEEIVRGLKNLAKELQIPVVALAQVSRACESRPDKRPHMGDIADASAIEKEADVIMTLYRDEVYNPDTTDTGLIELGICKNRHGPVGVLRAAWVGEYFQIKDLAPQHYQQGGYAA